MILAKGGTVPCGKDGVDEISVFRHGGRRGWPALFCTCDNCRRAAKAGGRNLRTRSQAAVDDKLLIDFPADTLAHMYYSGLDLPRIRDCIITHSHSDHLYPADLEMRLDGYAVPGDDRPWFFMPPKRRLRGFWKCWRNAA